LAPIDGYVKNSWPQALAHNWRLRRTAHVKDGLMPALKVQVDQNTARTFRMVNGQKKIMNILLKIMLGVAVVSACAVTLVVWSGGRTHITVQPNPQTGQQLNPQPVQQVIEQEPHHAVQSGEDNKNALVAAVNIQPRPGKPVAQAQTQQRSLGRVPVVRMIETGILLTKPVNSDPVKVNLQQNILVKTEKVWNPEATDGFGLDIGDGLPLPTPNSILIAPQDKPAGFHVDVDYRLDQKWKLTGMAGVMTTGGIVANPVKPSVNQVGVRASYRF